MIEILHSEVSSVLPHEVPVTVKVAIYVGELHHIEVLVADKLPFSRRFVCLPDHPGAIDLKPKEVLL